MFKNCSYGKINSMEFYKTEKPNSFLNRSIITNNTNNTWPSECLPISFVYVNNKYVYSCIIIVVGLVLCVLDECPYTFFLWLPPIHYLTAPSRYGWGMVSCIAHTQWLLCLCSSMNFFHRFGYVMMSQRVLHRIKGPSINDVTHSGGKGDQPKGDITP